MAERNQFDRLNEGIDAILSGRALPQLDPDLAMLLATAADLRGLPDPRFRARLKEELMPQVQETTVETFYPYFIVSDPDRLIDFLTRTFGATLKQRVPTPEGRVMHAEVLIGSEMVEMGGASDQFKAIAAPMHVYVEDVDAAYRRALEAGATSLYEPVDQPYGDREAGLTDPLGNEWFIATRAGMVEVRTGVRLAGNDRFLTFLENAFGAEVLDRSPQHSEVRLGSAMLETGEAHGQWAPARGAFHIFVADCDAVYERAVAAGGEGVMPPEDKPYGERSAFVRDDWGNQWFIATRIVT